MGDNPSNVKGLTAGNLIQVTSLEGQWRRPEPVPQARRVTMGELTDKAKGIANEVAGNVKQASGDPATRAAGKAQERKGEAQNLKGGVKGAFGDKV